jgi:ribosomal protein S18 acetylase RimI-like enzyme
MNIKIRKVKRRDLNGMVRLFLRAYAKPPYSDKWTKKDAIKSIRSEINRGEGYIAKEKGKMVGFITITKEKTDKIYLFIENLVVDENCQRKGIGESLVNKIEKEYKKDNTIISLAARKDSSAYKFYKRMGYKENKVNVLMGKRLK